jgi:hypothetical protein
MQVFLGGSQWTPRVLNDLRKRMPGTKFLLLEQDGGDDDKDLQHALSDYLK